MTAIATDASGNVDASGNEFSVTGAIIVSFNGTVADPKHMPTLFVESRSGAVPFTPTLQARKFGRFRINTASADEVKIHLRGNRSGNSISIDWVQA